MANGSFGLSGFPTAPTTTSGASGGGANNPTSSVTASVLSTSGFDAGELIYQRNNDFGAVPDNAVSTASFPVVASVAAMGAGTALQGQGSATLNLGQEDGGSNMTNMAATLTNGNIVYVFKAQSTSTALGVVTGNPYFKIVDQNGVTVVNSTLVSANLVQNTTIGVVALTGGGFVVYQNFVGNPRYAVYSNTGAVVTAPQTDSGITLSTDNYVPMRAAARPDGSWVLVVKASGAGQLSQRIYNSTGTPLYAWTSVVTPVRTTNNWMFDVVCRADNSSVIIGANNTLSSGMVYSVYSATNTPVVSSATFPIATSAESQQIWGNACVLSDGNVLFGYVATTANWYYRTLSPSNVLSAEVSVTAISPISTGAASVGASSSGGFLFTLLGTGGASAQGLYYIAYNSSYAPLYSTRLLATPADGTFTIIDTGTYLGVFNSDARCNSYTRFNKTTFVPVGAFSVGINAGVVSVPVNGYARGGSTPTSASFLAASTSTSYSRTTASTGTTYASSVFAITDGTYTPLDLGSSTFTDGRLAFIYMSPAGVVEAKIFSPSNVLLTTIAIATNGSTNTSNNLGTLNIIELENGKIAVCYPNSSFTATINVYSSSYTLLNSGTFSQAQIATDYQLGLAPLSGSRMAFTFINSSAYPAYMVLSDTLTTLTASTAVESNSSNRVSVASMPGGFVTMYNLPNSGFFRVAAYQESAANTWIKIADFGDGSGAGGAAKKSKVTTTPTGGILMLANGNFNGQQYRATVRSTPFLNTWGTAFNFNYNSVTLGSTTQVAGCMTAEGNFVTLIANGSGSIFMVVASSRNGGSGTQSTLTQVGGAPSLMALTSAGGDRVAFSYVADGVARYVIVDAGSDIISTVTAGEASQPALTLSPATGYTLLGVSTAAAPANGTGTVQINGPATLNSQYPATTNQTFDFQNPVTFGVAGVINGRNVNLQGNV